MGEGTGVMAGGDEIEVPRPTKADYGRDALAVVLNLAPGVGGSLTALVDGIFQRPLDKRRLRFYEVIADVAERVKANGLTADDLGSDEAFVSACIDAGRIAMGEHLEAKLEMLKACLIHQASPHDLSDLIATRFLELVGELEVQHVTVLRYAANPQGWYDDHGMDVDHVSQRYAMMERASLGIGAVELDFVVNELSARRLADKAMLTGIITATADLDPWITEMGRQFLAWITIV